MTQFGNGFPALNKFKSSKTVLLKGGIPLDKDNITQTSVALQQKSLRIPYKFKKPIKKIGVYTTRFLSGFYNLIIPEEHSHIIQLKSAIDYINDTSAELSIVSKKSLLKRPDKPEKNKKKDAITMFRQLSACTLFYLNLKTLRIGLFDKKTGKFINISYKTMANKAKVSLSTIKRYFRFLKDTDYVNVTRQYQRDPITNAFRAFPAIKKLNLKFFKDFFCETLYNKILRAVDYKNKKIKPKKILKPYVKVGSNGEHSLNSPINLVKNELSLSALTLTKEQATAGLSWISKIKATLNTS